MDLLQPQPALDLYEQEWTIHTRSEERPPVKLSRQAEADGSLLSNGCDIVGRVERSVLSPGVRVGPGAIVRDSILFNDTQVEAGATVDRAILDKNVVVPPWARIGVDPGADKEHYHVSAGGVTVLGKGVRAFV